MNKYERVSIIIFFIMSCGIHKKQHNEKEGKVFRNSVELISEIDKAKKLPKHLIIDTKISIKKQKNNQKVISKIEIKKDSFIVASIKEPFIGLEIIKVKLTPDSVYYINHIKNEWFVQPHNYLQKYFQVEISFSEIQQLLLAEIKIPKEEYTLFANKESYTITNKKGDKKYEINKQTLKVSEVNIQRKNKKIHINIFNYQNQKFGAPGIPPAVGRQYFFPKRLKIKFVGDKLFFAEINYLYFSINPSLFWKRSDINFKIPKEYVEIK